MNFAKTLKRLRTDNGYDQIELARQLGVSQKTISSWETGRTEPSMGVLKEMCRVFNCSMEDLTGSKKRNVGDVSYEDVIFKIGEFSIDELQILDVKIRDRIEQIQQLETIKHEKELLLMKIKEYEDKLSILEQKIDNN